VVTFIIPVIGINIERLKIGLGEKVINI